MFFSKIICMLMPHNEKSVLEGGSYINHKAIKSLVEVNILCNKMSRNTPCRDSSIRVRHSFLLKLLQLVCLFLFFLISLFFLCRLDFYIGEMPSPYTLYSDNNM